MAISLGTLVERLQTDVPAYNSIPSGLQYENAVKDAILEYAKQRGRRKIEELSLVTDQASYALPGDFVSLIKIARPAYETSGVIVSSSGLIPTGLQGLARLQWYIEGANIIFEPAPTFDEVIELWFVAGFEDNGSGDYTTMLDGDAGTLLLWAASICLNLQANASTQEAWSYAIGDERVDKQKQSAAFREQAKALEARFKNQIKTTQGSIGRRATYDSAGR